MADSGRTIFGGGPGGNLELADYSYDPDTDTWTVQPNATPGTALFTAQPGQSQVTAGLVPMLLDTAIANPKVGVLDPDDPTKIVVAQTGMYLATVVAQMFSGDWNTSQADDVWVTFDGTDPGPFAEAVMSSPAPSTPVLQSCMPVLLQEGWKVGVSVGSTDHAWQFMAPRTRLMLIRLT